MKKILVPIFAFMFITVLLAVATEDLTTFTEEDPANAMTETATRVTFVNVQTTYNDVYLYKDYGADYFSSNFIQYLTVYCAEYNQYDHPHIWVMANVVDDCRYMRDNDEPYFDIHLYSNAGNNPKIELCEWIDGVNNNDFTTTLSVPFTYYLTVVRNELVGTYGTMYLYIYSDATRTTLVDLLTVTLQQNTDFRYLYAFNSLSDNVQARYWNGYVENLSLTGALKKNVVVVN